MEGLERALRCAVEATVSSLYDLARASAYCDGICDQESLHNNVDFFRSFHFDVNDDTFEEIDPPLPGMAE